MLTPRVTEDPNPPKPVTDGQPAAGHAQPRSAAVGVPGPAANSELGAHGTTTDDDTGSW